MARDARNIEKVAEDAIRRGLSNQDALAEVLRIHPSAKTKIASISWYRNRLRSNGEDIPMARNIEAAEPVAPARVAEEPQTALPGPSQHLDVVRASLRDWKTNRQALEATIAVFPNAKVNLHDVSSVRTRMRDKDERIPTDNEARRRQEGRQWAADLKPN